jgi:hypothetical protein
LEISEQQGFSENAVRPSGICGGGFEGLGWEADIREGRPVFRESRCRQTGEEAGPEAANFPDGHCRLAARLECEAALRLSELVRLRIQVAD